MVCTLMPCWGLTARAQAVDRPGAGGGRSGGPARGCCSHQCTHGGPALFCSLPAQWAPACLWAPRELLVPCASVCRCFPPKPQSHHVTFSVCWAAEQAGQQASQAPVPTSRPLLASLHRCSRGKQRNAGMAQWHPHACTAAERTVHCPLCSPTGHAQLTACPAHPAGTPKWARQAPRSPPSRAAAGHRPGTAG